ncbi:MAG: metal-dependent transcriptional regulator [Actinobacteria bacterium]|nr:metal-dependent transcriptional regulator [Actinomycetota bacterium]
MAEMHDTTEEYLEQILELEEEGTVPMRARIVERLGLSAAAVSETVNRLVDNGYAELREDRSIRLTAQGRDLATTVVRRHRLAERLLLDVIGLEWEKVHREADRWEHVISDDVEAKLIELLGDPATCPHGNPIPGTARALPDRAITPLIDAAPGATEVARVSEKLEISDDHLHFVAHARLIPGAAVTVVERTPEGVVVQTTDGDHTVPLDVAQQLYVTV